MKKEKTTREEIGNEEKKNKRRSNMKMLNKTRSKQEIHFCELLRNCFYSCQV